ncbi:AAA family ATPase [Streptomyces sp. NPDC050263]|uniref:helix-turn-helix transcriptional regulator n=1 Tax=Streptomyces sp. NPDC050263 TaxID=3155037 RepID=UPI00342180EB
MNPLAGREHILAALGSRLDATAQGSGNCVILEGSFGMGKTQLLQAAALEAAERGLTAVVGRTGGTDHLTPVHLLINFLRRALSGSAGLDDLVRPGSNPFCLMDRIGELVEDAARRHPLVIVLDDIHRIDDVSALALRELVRSLASSPVLWLLARRPVPSSMLAQHALDWLIDHAAVRLHVGALDDEAVAELCSGILGAKPDSSVLRWAVRCEGNPWLVKNVFRALMKAGQVVVLDGTASVLTERVPAGVRTAIDRLLDGMSPGVRRLVEHGGRSGRPFAVEQVSDLLGEPTAGLSTAVEEAVQVGLVRREGAELAFTHAVIAEALQYAASSDSESAGPAAVPSPAVRLPQTGATDFRPDRPNPVPSAVTPATPPRPSSPRDRDDSMTTRAVSALARHCDDTPEALARVLRLLVAVGRDAEASRLLDIGVRPGLDAAAETQLVLELGQGLRDADCDDLSAELLRRALARQDIGELDRAKLSRAVTEAAERVSGEPGTMAAPAHGQPTASSHSDAYERPLWTWLARALVAVDRFDAAAAVLTTVKEEADRLDETWPESLWHGHQAELLAATGRLEEARAEAESALRLAEWSAPEHSVPARLVLARISTQCDDLATASEQLRMAERLVPGGAAADRTRLDWALAQFHAASGRPAMMVQTLINVQAQTSPDPLLFSEAPTAAATLIRQAKQAGLGAEAEQAAAFARHVAERNPGVQSLRGGAEHAEGVLYDDATALHRAAELHRLAGHPLAAGNALEDAARVNQCMGGKSRAVQLLESALDLYLDCGATRDTARVQRKLRRLGVHPVRRLGAGRPKSGWESLTSAELRVVRAIVDGRTNREAASALFLSPHTVDSHLRRVFSKLDINSRVKLTQHFFAHETPSPVPDDARQLGVAG